MFESRHHGWCLKSAESYVPGVHSVLQASQTVLYVRQRMFGRRCHSIKRLRPHTIPLSGYPQIDALAAVRVVQARGALQFWNRRYFVIEQLTSSDAASHLSSGRMVQASTCHLCL